MKDREQREGAAETPAEEPAAELSPLHRAAMRRRVLQRKASHAPEARAAEAPAAGGGGSALPGAVRKKMEQAFSADFGDVRVHQDGAAASVGAQAYARGGELHFAPGRFDPASREGQSLIGHELTHVMQQRAGRVTTQGRGGAINADPALEAEADDLGARAGRGEKVSVGGATSGAQRKAGDDAVQLKVDTPFGEFQDTAKKTMKPGKKEGDPYKDIGADMVLTFMPNENVNATKIGFMQSVKTTKSGDVQARGMEERAVPGGEHQGYRIDTVNSYNPMYGATELDEPHTTGWENAESAQRPEAAEAVRANYQSSKVTRVIEEQERQVDKVEFGHHAPPNPAQQALMRDAPRQINVPRRSRSSQELETTAVALTGEDQGKYYGTVKWGWTLDDSDQHTLIPLAKTSDGMGEVTKAAAAQWNQVKRKEGEAALGGAGPNVDGGRLKSEVPTVPIKIPE